MSSDLHTCMPALIHAFMHTHICSAHTCGGGDRKKMEMHPGACYSNTGPSRVKGGETQVPRLPPSEMWKGRCGLEQMVLLQL